MPKPGEIKYCDLLGGHETNASFVWVPPGSFWMGHKHDTDNPVHFVTISKGFWLQQTVLTDGQYNRLAQYSRSENENRSSNTPKESLTWHAVHQLCQNKPLRMPTEAEWEMAARAGCGHKYLNSGSNHSDSVAWTSDNSPGLIRPVAELKPNNYQFFDMSGNVHQWCIDEYDVLSSLAKVDPVGSGWNDTYIIRGSSIYDDRNSLFVSFRTGILGTSKFAHLGVRLVWEI